MAGVRSSKTVGSTKYDFTTLSGLVTRQTGGGKTIDFVYDENNQPLAMKYNNTLYYYVLNAQGDVIALADQNGNLIAKYSYDPWGKLLSVTPNGWLDEQNAYYLEVAEANPLRYRGYYYDSETGFYYLQSRYYDPEIGRFINADSYASTDATGLLSTNMFAYCENDPVNKSDPDGEVAHLAIGAVVGAIANVGFSYLNHMIAGESYGLKEAALDALSGAASGALAASGVGLLGQVIGNGLTSGVAYFARADINNQRTTTSGFLVSIAEGMMSGAIGGKGADGAKLSGVYKTAKQMIGNTTSPKKIAMYSAKIVGVKKTIVEGVSRLNLSLMFSNFIGNVRSKLVNLTSWKR